MNKWRGKGRWKKEERERREAGGEGGWKGIKANASPMVQMGS